MPNNIKEIVGISSLLTGLLTTKIIKYNKHRSIKRHGVFKLDCIKMLPKMKNISIKDFCIDSYYETVYFDTKKLPHVEFLLRNIINKFDSYWSHTVVTGLDNYSYMKKMCESISPLIKVIKLNIKNLDLMSYNSFFGNKEFWSIFKGEKLFFWSNDTIVYKNNITDFLQYDFIGAPYPKKWKYPEGYCNGAISLRTKSVMLKCLDKVKFQYSKEINGKLEKPEDIYFSETIYKYKVGKLPNRETQLKFSMKDVYSNDPFCGHCDLTINVRMYDRKKKFKHLITSGYFNFLNNSEKTYLLK